MSHTTKIKGVALKSLSAIETAVRALQAAGANIVLTPNLKPRMYYDRGPGRRGVQYDKDASTTLGREVKGCDYCIEIKDGPYDVGLSLNPATGEYEVIADTFGNHVGKVLGSKGQHRKGGLDGVQADLGEFYKQYSRAASYEWAAASGYMVESEEEDQNGQIHLTFASY